MKLVILERDGVVNPAEPPILSVEQWTPLPGSLDAMARLQRAGYRFVLITHQPAVGQKRLSMEVLNRMHNRLIDSLRHKGAEIDAIFVCPHEEGEACRCRKPQPGLLEDVAERLKINLSGVYVVGHDEAGMTAARAVGAMPVLVKKGVSEVSVTTEGMITAGDLLAFSQALLDGRLNA